MTIGIIILCIAILFIFFGFMERFFRRLGIANWLAFLLVLLLVVGAVVPNISASDRFSLNVSGFLIPIAIAILFIVLIGWGWELGRAALALLSVAGITVVIRMLMPDNTNAMVITTSLLVGFLGGAVAYLTSQTRMAVIVGTMGGIVLGDVIVNLINRFIFDAPSISLGTGGVFNSLVIGIIFGLLLLEAVNALMRASNRRNLRSGALGFEAGEDIRFDKYDKKVDEYVELDEEVEQFEKYDDYFNDKML